MRTWTGLALCLALACGDEPGGEGGGGTDTTGGGGATGDATTAGTSGSASGPIDTTGGQNSTSSGSESSSETGEPPALECEDAVTLTHADEPNEPPNYGFTVLPPRTALSDTAYGYVVRTNIGSCATDRVEWTLVDAPAGAVLELGDGATVGVGETLVWEDGGDERERARLAWNLADIEPGCHPAAVQWRAWRDCGLTDPGGWAPAITQSFEISVLDNHWVSGDLHVHTRHSERGDEAGGAMDYYERMINAQADDAGDTFADRRTQSPRGRLHWLVFSEHTNNEREECGRHFSRWCAPDDDIERATGRDVVQALTEDDPSTLLVIGSEISNQFDGHFGFLPTNPFPGHPIYAPGFEERPTDYDFDVGFGEGVFRERWVDDTATNAEELELIGELGGLAIINHEAAEAPWIEYDWSSMDFDGLEVWNGGNRHDRHDDSAYNGGIDVNAINEGQLLVSNIPEDPIARSWVGVLKTGKWPLALVGGSDVHDYNEIVCGSFPCDFTNAELASPMTTVWAPNFVWTDGASGVLDGIEAGRVVVHDRSNFIDLRMSVAGQEHMVGSTVEGYVPDSDLGLHAFGRVADFVDGDNRVLLILGTNGDEGDDQVDVLYNSADEANFVDRLQAQDDALNIAPDSNFDRRWTTQIGSERFGRSGTYFVWAQFIPWQNPAFLFGMGRDMAETGAIRILLE